MVMRSLKRGGRDDPGSLSESHTYRVYIANESNPIIFENDPLLGEKRTTDQVQQCPRNRVADKTQHDEMSSQRFWSVPLSLFRKTSSDFVVSVVVLSVCLCLPR